MDSKEFLHQQRVAVERMREMNARATDKQNQNQRNNYRQPINNNRTKSETQNENKGSTVNQKSSGLNLPFPNKLTSDSDTTLIIGLLLILMSEKSDKTLLFALMYILM